MSTNIRVLRRGCLSFFGGGILWKKGGKGLKTLDFSPVEKAVENVNNSL